MTPGSAVPVVIPPEPAVVMSASLPSNQMRSVHSRMSYFCNSCEISSVSPGNGVPSSATPSGTSTSGRR